MSGHLVEYAKSGRASCRGCKSSIGEGTLRLGKLVKSPHFDGDMTLWYHPKCFRESIPAVLLIKGFEDIKPSDQKALKEQFGGGSVVSSSSSSSSSSSNSMDIDVSKIANSLTSPEEIKIEYAKSNRSSCVECNEKIDSGALRIGKMEKSPKFDGLIPRWYHHECAFKQTQFVILSHNNITGFTDIGPDDQKIIKELIKKHNPATSSSNDAMDEEPTTRKGKGKKGQKRSRNNNEEEDEQETSKEQKTNFTTMTAAQLKEECKQRGLPVTGTKAVLVERLQQSDSSSSSSSTASTPEAQHEAALEKESEIRWKIREQAKEELDANDLRQFLDANHVASNGHKETLLERAVEILQFGVLPPCPTCNHRRLAWTDGQIKCHGNMNEWSACIYTAPDMDRSDPLLIDDDEHPFWSSFKFVKHKRNLAAHQWKAQLNAKLNQAKKEIMEKAEKSRQEREEKQIQEVKKESLFDGMAFAVAGSLSITQPVFKSMIEEHGGTVVNNASEANVLVATEEAVKKGGIKIKQATENKIPIVKEAFVHDSIQKLELQDPSAADYKLVDGDIDALKDVVEEVRKKSAAKSAAKSSSAKSGKSVGVKKLVIKGRVAVEELSDHVDDCHVLDEGGSEIWHAALSVTDIQRNKNSVYVLQVLEHDKKNCYYLFRKWGRMGDDSQMGSKVEEFYSANPAKRLFEELFLEKTGNHWSNRSSFTKVPGKMNYAEVDFGDSLSTKSEIKEGSLTKLDPRVQAIIRIMFDTKTITQSLLEMEIDLTKMPLGKLTRSHLLKGYNVLNQLSDLLQAESIDQQKLFTLTNQFYTIVPHVFNSNEELPLINSLDTVRAKLEQVNTLLEVEVTTRLLKDSANAIHEDPIDTHYKKLNTTIIPVEKETDEYQLISRYLRDTHASTHRQYDLELISLFKIEREGEVDRFAPFKDNPNRMLLWHGSRLTNWTGILSQGLRIAPPEAPATGYMFGKGVYFADASSKSANYCFTSSSNSTGFMILSEVALGDLYKLTGAQYIDPKPPSPYLSTFGQGKSTPNPKEFSTLDNGTVVPAGKLIDSNVKNSSLLYNEFIVYDIRQINIKYLLHLNFKYSRR